MKNKILWLGPIVDPEKQALNNTISPASNAWQLGFINGLTENEVEVTILSYLPDRVWPNGELWVKYPVNDTIESKYEIISVPYLNLFIIRDLWIPCALFLKIMFFKELKKHHFFYSYNIPFRHQLIATLIKFIYPRFKWISIIADDIAKGYPDYTVFLSCVYFDKFPKKNKIFLDGGVPVLNDLNLESINSHKVLLYAGSLSKWTAIEEFCVYFDSICSQLDIELHMYGKGNFDEINTLLKGNNKIKFFGFVSDNVLHEACKNAYAFVNPRPLSIVNGENNFPSKLLMYLSYNKPILSAKTLNVSKSYDSILNYFNDLDSLTKQLNLLLSSEEYYCRKCKSISNYSKQNAWKKKIEIFLKSIR